MELYLDRFCTDARMGTFGCLYMPGFFCYTVEKPWKNNEPWVSCIPEGKYVLEQWHFFRGGYMTYLMKDVPGRTACLIHVANRAEEVLGCIGIGDRLGQVHNEWAVLNSRRTFDHWYELMRRGGGLHVLTIRWLRDGQPSSTTSAVNQK